MDHISQHTNQVLQKEQPKQGNPLNNRTMSNLWERLTHLYGHKFASVYGVSAVNQSGLTETAKTWASGLNGLTGEQIANGLRECVDCGAAWPPTLPEFVGMCKGTKNKTINSEIYVENRRSHLIESDEVKASRSRLGAESINEMRKGLRRKS